MFPARRRSWPLASPSQPLQGRLGSPGLGGADTESGLRPSTVGLRVQEPSAARCGGSRARGLGGYFLPGDLRLIFQPLLCNPPPQKKKSKNYRGWWVMQVLPGSNHGTGSAEKGGFCSLLGREGTSGNSWVCFLVVTNQGKCYCHLVGRGQGPAEHSPWRRTAPQQSPLAPNVNSTEVGRP